MRLLLELPPKSPPVVGSVRGREALTNQTKGHQDLVLHTQLLFTPFGVLDLLPLAAGVLVLVSGVTLVTILVRHVNDRWFFLSIPEVLKLQELREEAHGLGISEGSTLSARTGLLSLGLLSRTGLLLPGLLLLLLPGLLGLLGLMLPLLILLATPRIILFKLARRRSSRRAGGSSAPRG